LYTLSQNKRNSFYIDDNVIICDLILLIFGRNIPEGI